MEAVRGVVLGTNEHSGDADALRGHGDAAEGVRQDFGAEAFAADIADDDAGEAVALGGMEEVTADFLGGAVDGLDVDWTGRALCGAKEESLHALRGLESRLLQCAAPGNRAEDGRAQQRRHAAALRLGKVSLVIRHVPVNLLDLGPELLGARSATRLRRARDDGPFSHLELRELLLHPLELFLHAERRVALRRETADGSEVVLPEPWNVRTGVHEYGGGRPEWIHAELFARAMRALGLNSEYGAYLEVIPGVTSAISVPAAAGIPVTHRGLSQGFCVLAGHVGPDDSRS